MNMQKNRRNKYLIDKKIQFSFLSSLVISIIIVSIFFGFFLFRINEHLTKTLIYTTENKLTVPSDVIEDEEYKVKSLRSELSKRDMLFNIQIIFAIILMSLLVGFYAIRFSHRIAGPIYRFKRSLEQAVSGDYSVRVRLRKRDFLKDLADDFNRLMDSLEEK